MSDIHLGDWGKHLVKEYGLSAEQAEDLELEAAELYAHDTEDGWCCACEADIAFAKSTLLPLILRALPEKKPEIESKQHYCFNDCIDEAAANIRKALG